MMMSQMNTATKKRNIVMMGGDESRRSMMSTTQHFKDVVKTDVHNWVTDSNWRKLREYSTNQRTGEAYKVYSVARFRLENDVMCVEDMTTLRLAMLYAFSKSKSAQAADAMETVRTLMRVCGVKPSSLESETQGELLDFIAFRMPRVFPDATEDCGARLMAMVLEEDDAFVGTDESAMDAIELLTPSGNDGMVSKLLIARRDLLSQASVFEAITRAMVHGTEPMVLSSLRILEAKIGRTTHHASGSTLLHFAVKRDAGRYVETVIKYCDVMQKDNKGRTAAECLPLLLAASEERIEELRALLSSASSQP
jgi:hypothetical protein